MGLINSNDTPWIGYEGDKLYLQSGQFTSTVKTSLSITAVDTVPLDIDWDGTNTPWIGFTDKKLYLQSGQFTSTIKDSEDISGVDTGPGGISWDETNTPWCGSQASKLYLQSGQFTSTVKTSLDVSAVDATPTGVSWDGLNTPWVGTADNKLYLNSGQFTSTIKDSEDVNAVDTDPTGISWDVFNTPWSGGEANKLYLQSGQFTSTIKDSEDVSGIDTDVSGISTNQVSNRVNTIEIPDTISAIGATTGPSEIAVRSAIFLIGPSATDVTSFIELYPDYEYTFTKVKDHVDNRTLSGKMYSYTFSTFDIFDIPESWINSADRTAINSFWLANTNLEFYQDYNTYPASFHDVRITNKEEPYPNFVKPYFRQFFEGTLNLETY
jgi:hypothetical protein